MEALFHTTLSVEGSAKEIAVFFNNEEYQFLDGNTEVVTLRREHDKWISRNSSNPQLIQIAINELDRYLLSQH